MQISTEPKKLAQWLSIVLAQRKRAREAAAKNYGTDSAAVAELEADIAEVNIAIGEAVKEASKQTLKK